MAAPSIDILAPDIYMPESEKAMSSSKTAIINKIRTERITKSQVLFNYINAKKFGLTYDIRRDVFEKVPAMTFKDLKDFRLCFNDPSSPYSSRGRSRDA